MWFESAAESIIHSNRCRLIDFPQILCFPILKKAQTVKRKDAINWIYLNYLLSLSTKCLAWTTNGKSVRSFCIVTKWIGIHIDFILLKNVCIMYCLLGWQLQVIIFFFQINFSEVIDFVIWIEGKSPSFKVSNRHNGKYSHCELKRWFPTETNAKAAGKSSPYNHHAFNLRSSNVWTASVWQTASILLAVNIN